MVKTHKGVQRELGRPTWDEPGFGIELRGLLGRTSNLKAIADYETGPGAAVTTEKAAGAIAEARRFITAIMALMPDGDGRES